MTSVFHWSKAQIQASKSWACHCDVMVTSDVTSNRERPPVESDVTILGVDLKVTKNGTSTQSDFTEKGFKKTGNLKTNGCYRCLDLH